MSAKNRGATTVASENYPTPAWCVRRMLEVAPWTTWNWAELGKQGPQRILEPCAGEGAIVRVLRSEYPSARISTLDIRDTGDACLAAGSNWHRQYDIQSAVGLLCADLIITNPPFSLWREFARRGIASARWTCLLLRLGALAHLEGLPTPSIYVLPNRPQFIQSFKCKGSDHGAACGWHDTTPIDAVPWAACPKCGGKVQSSKSDASEYAWLVWGPQAPAVHVLADTPLAERKAAAA